MIEVLYKECPIPTKEAVYLLTELMESLILRVRAIGTVIVDGIIECLCLIGKLIILLKRKTYTFLRPEVWYCIH